MVGATGLEPAASWSQTKHSTKLSYAPIIHHFFVASCDSFYIILCRHSFVNTFFSFFSKKSFFNYINIFIFTTIKIFIQIDVFFSNIFLSKMNKIANIFNKGIDNYNFVAYNVHKVGNAMIGKKAVEQF
jgi:hypothetical protein